ncbi:MAG: dCMP deaminase family protein [Nitrososphaeraceae archaeon]|nr:dCMP deaminase family protein [Nitrososphaeraceae archaeon]
MIYSKKWDDRFIDLAYMVAGWSKDPTTKVGAVIVDPQRNIVSVGYNGLNSFANDDLEYKIISREEKRNRTIHAELNAIFNAAKNGSLVKDTTLYITYPPCSNCALAIIQSGIVEVVYPKSAKLHDDWKESNERSVSLFMEAQILMRSI